MRFAAITSEALDTFRQTGDAPADDLIRDLLEEYGLPYGRTLMAKLTDFQDEDFFREHELLSAFYKKYAQKPDFLSVKDLIRATDFYHSYQQEIGMVLAFYSLPYCYLAEDGARVLQLSGRVKNDTYNRLKETGYFLRRVMSFDLWENGKIYRVLLKVRLLHALTRYFTFHSGKWDMGWGFPVNQEDMAGTNLAFSFIVLNGLRKLGIRPDDVREKAYLKVWAAVGYIMGIEPGLAVYTHKEAFELDKTIAQRHFRASETGRELTDALMSCYSKMAESDFAGAFFHTQSRLLLGEKYADWLGVPASRIPMPLIHVLNKTSSFLNHIYN